MHFIYLDPGSSSYLIQAIVAGALGAVFVVKNFWFTIKAFFTGKKPKDTELEEN